MLARRLFIHTLFAVVSSGAVFAQADRLDLNPPLSQVFPLNESGGAVRVSYPILLNQQSILDPSDVLHFIYIQNTGGRGAGGRGGGDDGVSGKTGGGHGHKRQQADNSATDSRGSGVGGGGTDGDNSDAPKPSKTEKKAEDGEVSSEIWSQASQFKSVLEEAIVSGTTLVYSVPGKAKPSTTVIDLPDGMLLGEIDNHIRVLALSPDSKSFQAGVRPGDEIRSFKGTIIVNSLKDFSRAFKEIQHQAQDNGHPYKVEVWRPADSKIETVQITPPPTFKSAFESSDF